MTAAEWALVVGELNHHDRSIGVTYAEISIRVHFNRPGRGRFGLGLGRGVGVGQRSFFGQSDCILKQLEGLGSADWETIDEESRSAGHAQNNSFVLVRLNDGVMATTRQTLRELGAIERQLAGQTFEHLLGTLPQSGPFILPAE